MKALSDLTVLVPESRELDLFTIMLEEEGASVLRCPLVRILDLEETQESERWIRRLIAGEFQDVIWLTGEGLRRLLPIVRSMACEEEFLMGLARVRSITRGPKPARALRELGLAPGLAAAVPTSQGVLDALKGENLRGRRIGVQLYPGGAAPLLTELKARGAEIRSVTPYRYASQAETHQVGDMVRAMAAGHIGLLAFTASPQVERLFQVARDANVDEELAKGLARTPIAAIGPVVEETLERHGVKIAIRPPSSFHLKPLVRAIIAWRSA